MANFKKDHRLDDYQLSALEAIYNQPDDDHTGPVIRDLVKRGVIGMTKKGEIVIYSHIREEWLDWKARDLTNGKDGKPYGAGVKVK